MGSEFATQSSPSPSSVSSVNRTAVADPLRVPPAPNSWAPVFLLALSFLGFVGIAFLLYAFKFDGVTARWEGIPTRVFYVLFLTLAASPFVLTVFRRVPILMLIPPVLLIFFIYPLFSPYGIPYSRDPIFNLQFAQAIFTAGSWHPLTGVVGQGNVYSYFPGGAVFNAEAASLTSLTLFQTFPWAYELLRLLVIPLAIYALTSRLFGPRPAPLAVLFYISVPSIELNVPTQQDFAVTFFILAFAALAFLATESTLSPNLTFLRVAVVVGVAMVVISHHVSTYILLGFLGGLAVLPWILRRKDPYPAMRSAAVFFGAVALALVWVAAVTLPVLQAQRTILGENLNALLHPSQTAPQAVIPGATFPIYLVAWIAAAAIVEGVLAIIVLAESYRRRDRAFVSFSILTSILVAVLSVPFFSTGLNFLVLRQFEYTGVIFAPAAAWWIAAHLTRSDRGLTPQPAPFGRPTPPPERRRTTRGRPSAMVRWGLPALAVVLVVLVFAGGSLVPLSTRDQFAGPKAVLIDSPIYLNQTAYAAGVWAQGHLSNSHALWGDYLVYTVFGGFAGFKLRWDSYPLFEGAGFSSTAVSRLHPGDFVVTDTLLATETLQPIFYGPLNDQPSTPITPTDLAKFDNPVYFSVIYQDPIFTIYQATNVAPPVT
ncbi:MAG: hypothetical protein L3K10_04155 [Thermoplasmata archaeon]|nr:hypothetical protein [Thermoplasmata archaeon]